MAIQMTERPVRRAAADLKAFPRGRFLSVTSFKRDRTGVATRLDRKLLTEWWSAWVQPRWRRWCVRFCRGGE